MTLPRPSPKQTGSAQTQMRLDRTTVSFQGSHLVSRSDTWLSRNAQRGAKLSRLGRCYHSHKCPVQDTALSPNRLESAQTHVRCNHRVSSYTTSCLVDQIDTICGCGKTPPGEPKSGQLTGVVNNNNCRRRLLFRHTSSDPHNHKCAVVALLTSVRRDRRLSRSVTWRWKNVY